MKAGVMISIRPEWCEKIAQGKKTIEVRKTKPKEGTPFKCYIYCTSGAPVLWKDGEKILKGSSDYEWLVYTPDMLNGKVIGEFVCDEIKCHTPDCLVVKEDREKATAGSCLTGVEIRNYLQGHKGRCALATLPDFYCWHISELEIYDTPKDLSDFYVEDVKTFDYPSIKRLKRPPQSWCYVEAIDDDKR